MIETFELQETVEWKERVEKFHEWYDKMYNKSTCTWESKDESKSWKQGSSKRSQNMPVTAEERRADPYEETKPWRDLGPANVEEGFLYPVNDPPCPVVHSQTRSKHDQEQCMKWICEVLKHDRQKSKDERVQCSHCDMNNHP